MKQLLQGHINDLIHACAVMVIVICATVLGAMGMLDRGTIGNVYLAGIGYAAGRAGATIRTHYTRASDVPVKDVIGNS